MFRPQQVPRCLLKDRTLSLYRGIRSKVTQKKEPEKAVALLSQRASRRMVPTHIRQL